MLNVLDVMLRHGAEVNSAAVDAAFSTEVCVVCAASAAAVAEV